MNNRFLDIAYGLSLLLFSLFLISCNTEKEPQKNVLAKINDYEITEDHFKSAFLRYYYKSGQSLQPSYAIKNDILNNELNVYVLATYAEEVGLSNSPEANNMKGMIERKVLNEEFLEREIFSEIQITDSEIRNMFYRLNTQLRASHLYSPNKAEADSLFALIESGKDFKELAAEVFENKRLSENGGDLGIFTVDEMDVAFERTAYQMEVGEISEPVRTAQGYSIIMLTDKISKPVMTEYELALEKQQIAYLAEKQEREILSREHMYNFMVSLSIDNEVVNNIWEAISGNYTAFQSKDFESFLLSDSDTKKLAKLENSSFELTVNDFISELNFTPSSNLNRVRNEETLQNLITGIAYRTYLMDQALTADINTIEEVNASIKQSYDVYLAKQAEQSIRNSIAVNNDEVRDVYYADPSKYYSELQINLSRIAVSSQQEAENIIEKLNAGIPFAKLVRQHTIRNEEKLYDGKLGFTDVSSFGFLSNKLSRLQKGDISEPLFYQSGEYHIYKCEGRIEAKPLSFKEAYDRVKNDVLESKFRSQRSEIIEEVKKRNGAMINTQKLKELTIQI